MNIIQIKKITKILKTTQFLTCLFIIITGWSQEQKRYSNLSPKILKESNNTKSNDFNNYNIIYQRLELEVDASVYYIKGQVNIYYEALNAIDSLTLMLTDTLQIDSICKGNLRLSYQHKNDLIHIDINQLDQFQIDSLCIFYQGMPAKTQSAFFIGVQDSVSLLPALATLSEPYGSSDWWPCKDNLEDKIDSIDINITCPIDQKAVSIGLLQSVDTSENWLCYRWKHRYPISPYLVAISVSDYYEYHSYIKVNNDDSIKFENYLFHENLENKKSAIDKTHDLIKYFDSLFVPYPFAKEKYGHVEFTRHGGMEHQTISSMGKFNSEIISHELAHQWFGDYITCNSWNDLWLNEAFGTYASGLYYEHFYNNLYWPIWKQLSINKITLDSTGSVFPVDTTKIEILFDERLTYRKASYILHMIRWTIGDEMFFEAIKHYLSDDNLAYEFAITNDLLNHFEAIADTSLTEFMQDWFYGESYPIYNIEWYQNIENVIILKLNQKSAANENFFRLFVPVRLIGLNDTIDLKLNNQLNGQSYVYPLDFKVDTVIFDPDLWLISKYSKVNNNIDESINQSLTIYPNPCNSVINLKTNEIIKGIEFVNSNGQTFQLPIAQDKIDVSYLSAGVYMIKVKTLNQHIIKKIIKY